MYVGMYVCMLRGSKREGILGSNNWAGVYSTVLSTSDLSRVVFINYLLLLSPIRASDVHREIRDEYLPT